MLKNLMSATAMVALLATGAVAADNSTNATTNAAPAANPAAPATDSNLLASGYQPAQNDNLASKLIGAPVYASADANADRIGDVNDLVINTDGSVAAVIVGVGGFLGVGEKNVAVDFSNVQQTMDQDNKPRLIVNTTKEALQNAPEFKWDDETQTANTVPANGTTAPAAPADNAQMANNAPSNPNANTNAAAPADNSQMAANAPADNTAATPAAPADNSQMAANAPAKNTAATPAAPADNTQMANNAPADSTAANPAIPPYNSTDLKDVTLTAQQLIGTNAYGPDNQHLGSIGDVVLGDDSKSVQAVIIDFGGFLGIGTKPVAVDIANLRVAQDQNGNKYVYINVTRDQLDQAVAFNADTFKDQRNQQLLQTQPLS